MVSTSMLIPYELGDYVFAIKSVYYDVSIDVSIDIPINFIICIYLFFIKYPLMLQNLFINVKIYIY